MLNKFIYTTLLISLLINLILGGVSYSLTGDLDVSKNNLLLTQATNSKLVEDIKNKDKSCLYQDEVVSGYTKTTLLLQAEKESLVDQVINLRNDYESFKESETMCEVGVDEISYIRKVDEVGVVSLDAKLPDDLIRLLRQSNN